MLSVETFDSKSAQAVLNSFCLICIRVCLRDRRSMNDSCTVCLRVRGKTRGERCRENGAWRTMQGVRCSEKDAARHRWRARHSSTARWWRQPWQEREWHRLSLIGSTPRTSAGMLGAHQSCPHFIWELPWDARCTSNPPPFIWELPCLGLYGKGGIFLPVIFQQQGRVKIKVWHPAREVGQLVCHPGVEDLGGGHVHPPQREEGLGETHGQETRMSG